MPGAPDRIAQLALMVVDEAAEQAERGERVPKSIGLRLALACLCSVADGPTFALPDRRTVFDTFWKEVTAPATGNPHSSAYYRASVTRTCLQQIGRQLGDTGFLFHAVRDARVPGQRARQEFAEAVRQAGADRDDAARTKRARYWGPKRR